MSNQLEVLSEIFLICASSDEERTALLMGEIEAFIDVKHRNGNTRMLIVYDYDYYNNPPSPEFVAVPITESINTSLKMQDAEVGDYIIIDSGVEAPPAEYCQFDNLVLINNVGTEGLRTLDYQSFLGNNLDNETDYEPKPLLIEPLVIESVEDSTD